MKFDLDGPWLKFGHCFIFTFQNHYFWSLFLNGVKNNKRYKLFNFFYKIKN